MTTTTVGDILTILSKYDLNTPVVTYDPREIGYNRVTITRMMVYNIMVNRDEKLPCDFVDTLAPDLPEGFNAIVL
jgi:hypothetical protein